MDLKGFRRQRSITALIIETYALWEKNVFEQKLNNTNRGYSITRFQKPKLPKDKEIYVIQQEMPSLWTNKNENVLHS